MVNVNFFSILIKKGSACLFNKNLKKISVCLKIRESLISSSP